MDDRTDNGNSNSGHSFPFDFTDIAYVAPFLGVALLGCFVLTLCCYLWRRISSPRGYSGSLESSSSSFRNRRTQRTQRQGQRAGWNNLVGGTRGAGHQFVSWARDHIGYTRRNSLSSGFPGQNYQTQAGRNYPSGNNLLTPMAAQYPLPTHTGARIGRDPSRTTAGEPSRVLSDSGGFSQATAPPPSYSCAVGYQNATTWNLPGYGYHSTDPRTGGTGTGGEQGEGDLNVLPPPYESAVGNGRNTGRT